MFKYLTLISGLIVTYIGITLTQNALSAAFDSAFAMDSYGQEPSMAGFYIGMLLMLLGFIATVVGASALGSALAHWERTRKTSKDTSPVLAETAHA